MESQGPVLLVDDDVELRELIAEALVEAGYVVVQAGNGEEALAYLREARQMPGVILLDLLMPVMNGWQFCEEARADPRLARIPVVAISSATSSDPKSPYYLDVAAAVPKPVTVDALIATIAAITSGRAAEPA